ncbi:MAG: hypothetical protein Q8R83_08130 [Legionellaceae bacterium]|nr:hypothetical protein [Legionellaceae bacterium]
MSSGVIVLATFGAVSIVDGATSIDSYITPNRSTHGKLTKVTMGEQEIPLNLSLGGLFSPSSAIINFNNLSERSMCCTIQACAPFGNWNRKSYTVEVYVSNRDMPHALERSQELRQEIRMLEEESINLQDALQRMIQEKQKIETAISLYKSPASVNSTLFYAHDRTSFTANEPVVTLGL